MALTKAQLVHKRITNAVLDGRQIFQHSDGTITLEVTVRQTDLSELERKRRANIARHAKKEAHNGR